MAKLLMLGAGLVARPVVHYLLDHRIELTLLDSEPAKAAALLSGYPGKQTQRRSAALMLQQPSDLEAILNDHDAVISLLPATMHPLVAEACLNARKHLITASYISPAMRRLHEQAEQNDLLFLNELGVDPGIDHMSAMRIIHHAQKSNGDILAFRSYCGGLPSKESNTNPWGYKFSWSPVSALKATTNAARYLKNGKELYIPPERVFSDTHLVSFDDVGELEAYPNRNALDYIELYGLKRATTMFRGTLRYPGWSETLKHLGELGLLDLTPRAELCNRTWDDILAECIGVAPGSRLRENVASFLWVSSSSPTLEKLSWLGLLTSTPFANASHAPPPMSLLEGLALRMQSKMSYAPDERDMVAMKHEFLVDYGSRKEQVSSSLLVHGVPAEDSAMARTVGLPVAIATRLLLEGRFHQRGVSIPTHQDIYQPILDELASFNIEMKECCTAL